MTYVERRPVDPIQRPARIRILPKHQRATAILREYLERRLSSVDATEAKSCRSFLKAYCLASANGNALGIELNAKVGASPGSVAIFAWFPRTGTKATGLPVLMAKMTDRLGHALREISESRAFPGQAERKPVDLWDDDKPAGRSFGPRFETTLIPGRRS